MGQSYSQPPDINGVGDGLSTCLNLAKSAEVVGKKSSKYAGDALSLMVPFLPCCFLCSLAGVTPHGRKGVVFGETTQHSDKKLPKGGWMKVDARPGFGLGKKDDWKCPHFS